LYFSVPYHPLPLPSFSFSQTIMVNAVTNSSRLTIVATHKMVATHK
jgi:hypothetical protein